MHLEEGQAVGHGRYVVEGLLGTGGMAAVYLVRHEPLGTRLALKVMRDPSASQRSRLLREGKAQAALKHPLIVPVVDVIEVDGLPALVMEYVAGPSLDEVLRVRPLTLDQVDDLARRLFDALEVAHAQGFVHRDLKPGNVMLEVTGDRVVPRVTDFGLVKRVDSGLDATSATRTGAMMGTPAYMAPEQVRDAGRVDERADVFSLGAVLYELVTGQRAFPGSDPFSVLEAVVYGRFEAVEAVRREAPERMVRAITAALAADRDHRPASVAALRKLWVGDALSPVAPWSESDRAAIRGLTPEPRAVDAVGSEETFPSVEDGPMDLPSDDEDIAWHGTLASLGVALALLVPALTYVPSTVDPDWPWALPAGPALATLILAPIAVAFSALRMARRAHGDGRRAAAIAGGVGTLVGVSLAVPAWFAGWVGRTAWGALQAGVTPWSEVLIEVVIGGYVLVPVAPLVGGVLGAALAWEVVSLRVGRGTARPTRPHAVGRGTTGLMGLVVAPWPLLVLTVESVATPLQTALADKVGGSLLLVGTIAVLTTVASLYAGFSMWLVLSAWATPRPAYDRERWRTPVAVGYALLLAVGAWFFHPALLGLAVTALAVRFVAPGPTAATPNGGEYTARSPLSFSWVQLVVYTPVLSAMATTLALLSHGAFIQAWVGTGDAPTPAVLMETTMGTTMKWEALLLVPLIAGGPALALFGALLLHFNKKERPPVAPPWKALAAQALVGLGILYGSTHAVPDLTILPPSNPPANLTYATRTAWLHLAKLRGERSDDKAREAVEGRPGNAGAVLVRLIARGMHGTIGGKSATVERLAVDPTDPLALLRPEAKAVLTDTARGEAVHAWLSGDQERLHALAEDAEDADPLLVLAHVLTVPVPAVDDIEALEAIVEEEVLLRVLVRLQDSSRLSEDTRAWLLERWPADADLPGTAAMVVATEHERQGQIREAQAVLERALTPARNRVDVRARLLSLAIRQDRRDLEDALMAELFTGDLEARDLPTGTFLEVARTLASVGRLREARELLRRDPRADGLVERAMLAHQMDAVAASTAATVRRVELDLWQAVLAEAGQDPSAFEAVRLDSRCTDLYAQSDGSALDWTFMRFADALRQDAAQTAKAEARRQALIDMEAACDPTTLDRLYLGAMYGQAAVYAMGGPERASYEMRLAELWPRPDPSSPLITELNATRR